MKVAKVKKRKLLRFSSAMVLAVCFFLPVFDLGCFGAPLPYEEIQRISSWQSAPFIFVKCGAPYLFGLLVSIVCLCDLLRRGRALRIGVGISLFILLVFSLVVTYVGIIATVFGPLGFNAVVCYLLWPILGVVTWCSFNVLQRKYTFDTKLVAWQLAGSVMVAIWFWLWVIGAFLDGRPGIIASGLWLSSLSSLVLSVCFAVECRQALECSSRGLLPALMGIEEKGTFYFSFGQRTSKRASAKQEK
jgi:hypothetical protein